MSSSNTASLFHGNLLARLMAWPLRAAHRLAPSLGTRVALRLFFTPLPLKTVARRRPVPAPWRAQRHPIEGGNFVLWRLADVARDDPAPRPSVLLVHGWAGDAMQLRVLGEALAQAGFDPVLLDFPAHGRSGGWRSTLPQFVRTLFAVQARVGPLHAVVAHSLGAVAAAHAAAKGLAVRRLALLSPSPPPTAVIRWFTQAFGLGEALARRMTQAIERAEGMRLSQFEPQWLGPRLAQPTLVVHDQGDKAVPVTEGQTLARALPQGQLLVTQGLGHRRGLEAPVVVEAVLSHLG